MKFKPIISFGQAGYKGWDIDFCDAENNPEYWVSMHLKERREWSKTRRKWIMSKITNFTKHYSKLNR